MSVTLPYPRAVEARRRRIRGIVENVEGRPMDDLTPAQRAHVIAQAASAAAAHAAAIRLGRSR